MLNTTLECMLHSAFHTLYDGAMLFDYFKTRVISSDKKLIHKPLWYKARRQAGLSDYTDSGNTAKTFLYWRLFWCQLKESSTLHFYFSFCLSKLPSSIKAINLEQKQVSFAQTRGKPRTVPANKRIAFEIAWARLGSSHANKKWQKRSIITKALLILCDNRSPPKALPDS